LPNGFDIKTFPSLPNKEEAKEVIEKHFGISLNGRKILLTVGRKVKRKGHEWFITEVLPKVTSKVIYLTVGDGPESNRLNEVIENTDTVHTVKFAGRISDDKLKQMYAAADVFVMPNISVPGDMEGFGVVMLEANSAGCPVVASALEGILDVIEEAENGYLVPEGDSSLFAERIDQYVNSDLRTQSQNAREYVLNKFSWTNVAKSYVRLLENLSKSNHIETL
jgi:phosphatidylinositol alpha-1,6-mannosyltransferase